MTSQNKKSSIETEWKRVNESIDSLLSQLTPQYTEIGVGKTSEGFFNGKSFHDELDKFATDEYNRAKKENKGFLDPEEFKKKLIDNYTKHYRYRATRTSIIKLKLFLDFLCNRKGNTLSSQFMWPEDSNPILSPTVVRFMRKCSEEFDKRKKRNRST